MKIPYSPEVIPVNLWEPGILNLEDVRELLAILCSELRLKVFRDPKNIHNQIYISKD